MSENNNIAQKNLHDAYLNLAPEVQKILVICSWLAPEKILPLDFLGKFMEGTPSIEVPQLEKLSNEDLLVNEENGYAIRPEIIDLVHKNTDKQLLSDVLSETTKLMLSTIQNLDDSEIYQSYFVHVEALAQNAQRFKKGVAGLLLVELGRYLFKIGDYKTSVKYFKKGLITIKRVLGNDSPEYTANLNNLGSSLQRLGSFEEAKKCFDEAIIIDQKVFGQNDPVVATGHNNLAQVLLDMNSIEGALIHFEKALEINREKLGDGHPHVASGFYNMGIALISIGDYPRARAQLELALMKRKNIYGEVHPDVAEAHHGLGMILQTIGNIPGAIDHYQQAVNIWEEVGMGDQLKTAASYTNLGGVLHVNKDWDAAKENYEKAIAIFRKFYSKDEKNIQGLQFQIQLLTYKTSLPELMEKIESGEKISPELVEILDKMYKDKK
ncbi:MAG TPA: tetratricopeptide repeat protein [Anaerolineaceae bacterium]|nr:tetratricopeptide repeat protein [Anaerolineaceae bacterium]